MKRQFTIDALNQFPLLQLVSLACTGVRFAFSRLQRLFSCCRRQQGDYKVQAKCITATSRVFLCGGWKASLTSEPYEVIRQRLHLCLMTARRRQKNLCSALTFIKCTLWQPRSFTYSLHSHSITLLLSVVNSALTASLVAVTSHMFGVPFLKSQ